MRLFRSSLGGLTIVPLPATKQDATVNSVSKTNVTTALPWPQRRAMWPEVCKALPGAQPDHYSHIAGANLQSACPGPCPYDLGLVHARFEYQTACTASTVSSSSSWTIVLTGCIHVHTYIQTNAWLSLPLSSKTLAACQTPHYATCFCLSDWRLRDGGPENWFQPWLVSAES